MSTALATAESQNYVVVELERGLSRLKQEYASDKEEEEIMRNKYVKKKNHASEKIS